MTTYLETPTVRDVDSYAPADHSASANEASTPNTNKLSVSSQDMVASSPISVTPAVNPELAVASELSSTQEEDNVNIASDDTVPQEVAASAVVSDTPVRTVDSSPMYYMFLLILSVDSSLGLYLLISVNFNFQRSVRCVSSGGCTFFSKNSSWDYTGNYMASALSPLSFPSIAEQDEFLEGN